MYKKMVYVVTLISILAFIFILSYIFTSRIYSSKKVNPIGNMSNLGDNLAKQTNSEILEDIILPNNKITYVIKDSNSKDILWQFEEKSEALVGKNKKELEAIYGAWGYSVNFKNSEVTLEKESNKYKPNKYVIGSDKDGYTVLYKIDINGNLNIENKDRDIVYKKVQDMIDSGAYSYIVSAVISGTEFDSRDDAESCLGEIN